MGIEMNQKGVVVEINGKLSAITLEDRMQLNKNSFNYGRLKKLEMYLQLLDKFHSKL